MPLCERDVNLCSSLSQSVSFKRSFTAVVIQGFLDRGDSIPMGFGFGVLGANLIASFAFWVEELIAFVAFWVEQKILYKLLDIFLFAQRKFAAIYTI